MKIDKNLIHYIRDEQFSTSVKFHIHDQYPAKIDRVSILNQLIQGKKVIHLGCADHTDVIEQKIKMGIYLHKSLTEHSAACLGIDINEEAILLMKKLGFDNVVCADISKGAEDIPELKANHFDYLLMGELLEHIDNPVQFLASIMENAGQFYDRLIITVPNAFRYANFKFALNQYEHINTDHRYWFTPYTICKILNSAGFDVEELFLCMSYKLSGLSIIKKALYNRFPLLRENLIIIASNKK